MQVIGITGSIGTGKTTIADLCRDLGYAVYDVDAWVRRIYFRPEFLKTIHKYFPEAFFDEKFNKRALRNLVFNDNQKLKKLESLIHPFLKDVLKKMIRRNVKYQGLFFIDIALLFEMGWEIYCDFVILTDVDSEIQKNRVMNRDNISAEDFEKIVKVQMNNDEKKLKADIVINTDKPLNLLKTELLEIINGLENG